MIAQYFRGLVAGGCWMMTYMLIRFPGRSFELAGVELRFSSWNAGRSYAEAWAFGFVALVLTIISIVKAGQHDTFDISQRDHDIELPVAPEPKSRRDRFDRIAEREEPSFWPAVDKHPAEHSDK